MNNEQIKKLELEVATALVSEGLKAGYSITVNNGEEEVIVKSKDQSAILAAMFSVDQESLHFFRGEKWVGNVFLVYGNDGWDAVCDYHLAVEHIMNGVNAITDRY